MEGPHALNHMEIRRLKSHDSNALSAMLCTASSLYQSYFKPFSFEADSIRRMLEQVQKDKYWGIWLGEEMVAFFMLRGFDSGYQIPSYGVSIAEKYAGKGLLKVTLHFVLSWCKLNGLSKLMLKVNPENYIAKSTYEKFGFKQTSVDEKNGNLIYHLDIH